jgi:hypothetical protein
MSDSIRVTTSLRIERPVDVVKQQFRDIDHQIRNNVHPDVRCQWEQAPAGQRRIRTSYHLLGVEQHDLCELEDAADGAFVVRYLEGPQAGRVLVHHFAPLDPEATQVELVAETPATPARKLLGPLFTLGARQVLRKSLAENKRDLEQGAFVAGQAAGNLERALGFLRPADGSKSFVRPLAERDLAAKRAVLEAACLVAVADGQVQSGEIATLGRLAELMAASDERAWIAERARALADIALSPAIVAEATRIGRALVAEGVGAEGITSAVVVALVSEGMSLGELELLRELARVAGVPDGSLPAVMENAERALITN